MRSFFILYPQVVAPRNFKPVAAPPLLTQQDLWAESRGGMPSLLFRVRSESGEIGSPITTDDRLESCVGLVDSTTRWRVIFSLCRNALNLVQHNALRQALMRIMGWFASTHPATITIDQRQNVVNEMMAFLNSEGEKAPNGIEKMITASLLQVVGSDNDIEAAQYVPFTQLLIPFDPQTKREEYQGRVATVETVTGAALLTEASFRLSERMPIWIVSPMPPLLIPGADEPTGPRGDEEE